MARRRTRRRLYQEKKKRSGDSRTAVQPAREGNQSTESDNPILALQRAIGNQATTELLQRQEDEQGSATMVSSTAASELAADESSYTKKLTGEQAGDQTPTDEEFMGALEGKAGETIFRTGRETQHPSIAQMGIRPKNIKGFKVGVYIGNSGYKPPVSELPGAKADAARMKSTMEGHGYASLPLQEDKNARALDSILSISVQQAKVVEADALLLYYAGHGLPEGMLGIDAQEQGLALDSESRGEGDSERGFNTSPQVTDVEEYAKVMQHLAASVDNGVHTTLIVDACHSGSGTDLFRDKAVERLSDQGNKRMNAVSEQIARLEDLKRHVSLAAARRMSGSTASQTEGVGGNEAESADTRSIVTVAQGANIYEKFWQNVVRPELQQVSTYLAGAELGLDVPDTLGTYTIESIHQQINLFINKLIELGEIIKQEAEESTLEKVGV